MLHTHEPILTLHLPRSVAHLALAALRKQPLEQVEAAHAWLASQIQSAEEQLTLAAIEAKLTKTET